MKFMKKDESEEYMSFTRDMEYNLKGDAVFKGTLLPIFYIGNLVSSGEKKTEILEQYEYLTVQDLKMAKLYFKNVIEQDI